MSIPDTDGNFSRNLPWSHCGDPIFTKCPVHPTSKTSGPFTHLSIASVLNGNIYSSSNRKAMPYDHLPNLQSSHAVLPQSCAGPLASLATPGPQPNQSTNKKGSHRRESRPSEKTSREPSWPPIWLLRRDHLQLPSIAEAAVALATRIAQRG